MNCKHLAHLIYNCHNIPESRKDPLVIELSRVVNRANYRTWKKLLCNGLAVKEQFFRAYSPVSKERILEDLCEAIRRLKITEHPTKINRILDHIYFLDRPAPSEGETAAFFGMRLRQTSHKGVRAQLAAVIMELPEEHQRIEDVAAALHGNYLLSIRAMERLCAFGEPGLKAIYQLLDEISLTPAVTFTLFRIIENTCCRDSLKRTLSAKVFLKANQRAENTVNTSIARTSDSELRMMRSARVSRAVESCRAPKDFALKSNKCRRGQKKPVFLRLTATRKIKIQHGGKCHVSKKDHQDTSLRGGFTADPGDIGKERLRLSVQLKSGRFPAQL